MKKKIIKAIIQIIFIVILSMILVKVMKILKDVANGENFAEKLQEEIAAVQEKLNNKENNNIKATGQYEFKKEETNIEDKTYESFKKDKSVILAEGEANITILNSKINKKDGNNTDENNSKYYGINSAILVKNGAIATIKNTTILSETNGASAIFATGEKIGEDKESISSRVYIQNSEIKTTKESSRGLMCTYTGYIEANSLNITTQGKNSPALAVNKGKGTINIENSYFNTEGESSPIIYAIGNVSVENSSGKAKLAQMIILEGKSKVDLKNSTLECLAKGNEESKNNAGILIYQTSSEESDIGTAILNSKNSILKITEDSDYYKKAPLFLVTNTKSIINLENNLLQYGSGTLLKIAGTDEWGETASNGGTVTLNAINQNLTGDIEVDDISTIKINLTKGSSLESAINSERTGRKVELVIDKESKLKLTKDSYVTSFETEDKTYSNIDFNGYKLYVKGVSIN